MTLTSEQEQKALAWLAAKRRSSVCPTCGVQNWTLLDIVASPPWNAERKQFDLTPTEAVPVLRVACNNCGHLTEYACAPMGLP